MVCLSEAKLGAIIAKSFARIFFRSGINIGLYLLECDTDKINQGDKLKINLELNTIINRTTGTEIKIKELSGVPLEIVKKGGLVAYFKSKGYI